MSRFAPARSLAPRRPRLLFVLAIGTVLILVGGLLEAGPGTSALLATGPHATIQLTSGGGVSGNVAGFTPQELWGGGSPVESCLACTPTSLISRAEGQSTQSGQSVNPENGDFTTSDTIFSVPAIGGNLDLTLTYDAQASAVSGAKPGYFGYGWNSSFAPSLVYNSVSGIMTVNEENGAEVAFVTSNRDDCPAGDYEDFQKYTASGSSTLFCASNRVHAQVGIFPAYGLYQFDQDGGKTVDSFNLYGVLQNVGTEQDQSAITYKYGITPGTGNCPSSAGNSCITETDSAGRSIIAQVDGYGLIQEVTDPFGRIYTFGWDGTTDLTTIDDYLFDNGATKSFAYANPAPFNHEMTQMSNEDNDQTNVGYTNGMVTSVEPPVGAATTYSYGNTTCATSTASVNPCTGYDPWINPAGTSSQYTTVTYPDGEIDYDEYEDGYLYADTYGPSPTGAGDNSGTFQYWFPSPTNQDGPTSLVVGTSDGRTATIVTDALGNVTSYTDPEGHTTQSMYNDSAGNNLDELCWTAGPGVNIVGKASCSDPPIGSTYYTYDSFGNVLSETDPLGNTIRNGYYSTGLLCWTAPPSVIGGSQCTTPSSYSTDAPTGATVGVYDSQGDVTMKSVDYNDPGVSGQPSPTQTTQTEYNADGWVTYSIPPAGWDQGDFGANPYETSYGYYANGNVNTEVQPLGLQTTYTDDAAGNVIVASDPAGVTSNQYDGDGRLCWSYRGTAAIQNPPGCPTNSTPPAGSSSTTYWADTSAPVTTTDPIGNKTTYTYGNAVFPTKATEVQDPLNAAVTYNEYDQYGNVCDTGPVATNGCGSATNVTYNQYGADGELQETVDPDGNTTSYLYGDNAFPTKATERTSPMGEVTHYSYDQDGNEISTTDPEGNVTTIAYDKDGRVCYVSPVSSTSGCGSPPTAASTTALSYDGAGNRLSMTDYKATGSVVSSYTYLTGGELNSVTDDNGRTVSYTYDTANDVTCIAYPVLSTAANCNDLPSPTNSVVKRTYNKAGQLSSTEDWLGNTIQYGNYDPNSNLGTITYPSIPGESVNYHYNSDSQVTSATYSGPLDNGAQDSWTYNADGQVHTSSQLGSFSSTDQYNDYGQVTAANNPGGGSADSYSYQTNGAPLKDAARSGTANTYNFDSEMLTSTSGSTTTSYDYNADGQRTSSSSSAASTSFGWNNLGELCWSAAIPSSSNACTQAPSGADTYTYDGNGRRTSETMANGTVLDFTWDTQEGSVPLDIDDGVNAYIYGPTLFGGTAPVEQINLATGDVTFMSSTPSGVQLFFDQSDVCDAQVAYSTYGQATLQTSSSSSELKILTSTPNFFFQGAYEEDPFGTVASDMSLVYLMNRYYDPVTAQFLSVDPMVAQTGEPYAFTRDDPLNLSDPIGLDAIGAQVQAQADVYAYWYFMSALAGAEPYAGADGIPTTGATAAAYAAWQADWQAASAYQNAEAWVNDVNAAGAAFHAAEVQELNVAATDYAAAAFQVATEREDAMNVAGVPSSMQALYPSPFPFPSAICAQQGGGGGSGLLGTVEHFGGDVVSAVSTGLETAADTLEKIKFLNACLTFGAAGGTFGAEVGGLYGAGAGFLGGCAFGLASEWSGYADTPSDLP